MRIYFVRHGESTSNAERIHQGSDAPLSEEGRKQAKFIAERVSKLSIDAIIASPYVRTKETAEIIAQKIDKSIEWSDLFTERRQPSEIVGMSFDSQFKKNFHAQAIANAANPDWKFSDEESFTDLKKRAEDALKFLLAHNEQHILVVTHGFFKRLLIGSMLFGAEFNSLQYKMLRSFLYTSNTGISVCDYLLPDDGHSEPRWKLITWNDHAHLG